MRIQVLLSLLLLVVSSCARQVERDVLIDNGEAPAPAVKAGGLSVSECLPASDPGTAGIITQSLLDFVNRESSHLRLDTSLFKSSDRGIEDLRMADIEGLYLVQLGTLGSQSISGVAQCRRGIPTQVNILGVAWSGSSDESGVMGSDDGELRIGTEIKCPSILTPELETQAENLLNQTVSATSKVGLEVIDLASGQHAFLLLSANQDESLYLALEKVNHQPSNVVAVIRCDERLGGQLQLVGFSWSSPTGSGVGEEVMSNTDGLGPKSKLWNLK